MSSRNASDVFLESSRSGDHECMRIITGPAKMINIWIIVHGLAISELGFVDDCGIAFHCCRLGRQRLDLLRHILHHRARGGESAHGFWPVSYTHLRAHETVLDLVCRLLLE